MFGRRHQVPVVAALSSLHPHHVGSEIRKKRRAVGTRNISTEIEHANAIEYAVHHRPLVSVVFARLSTGACSL